MLQRTRQIDLGCNGGPCPHVHETTIPGIYAVQGERPGMSTHTDWVAVPGLEATPAELAGMAGVVEVPGHENVVLVLRETLDGYAATGTMPAPRDCESVVLLPAPLLAQSARDLVPA